MNEDLFQEARKHKLEQELSVVINLQNKIVL